MKTTITLFLFSILLFQSTYSQCGGADFEERNGIAVIEMESASSLGTGWKRETGSSGFTGKSFLAWRGSDKFNSPGTGVTNYKVKINSPGIYRIQWRNRVGIGTLKSEHNDSWLRVPDAFDFFAQKGSSIKYPKGGSFKKSTKTVAGASGSGWMKVFNSGGAGSWNWSTNTSDFDSHKVYAEFKNSGVYTIQISGRSKGHFIDRMVLYKENQISQSSATSTSRSETKCGGSGGGDDSSDDDDNSGGDDNSDDDGGDDGGNSENQAPIVSITNPGGGQNFSVGANVSINLLANDSDGNISSHIIFVNGNRVDTDGSRYTPHVIKGISAGNYTVRAEVKDNDGATAEDTVDFTVGGGDDDNSDGDDDNSDGGDDNSGGGDDNSDGDGSTSVSITNPDNGQNFSVGSNIPVNLNTTGNIVRHIVFINNKKVDTDQSKYTAHIIRNVTAGNYSLRVEVTDNTGKKASDTVSFGVGSGNDGGSDDNSGGGDDNSGGGDDNSGGGEDGNNDGNDQAITFSLINSSTNNVITSISNGSNLDSGSNVNIRAISPFSGTKSLYLVLNGPKSATRVENIAPYSLFGDTNGNYSGENLPSGSYSITATAYSGGKQSGSILGTTKINFTVSTQSSALTAKAFPNPVTSNRIFISLPNEVSGKVYYSIFNSAGVELDKGMGSVKGKQMEIQLNNYTTSNGGIYYVKVQSLEDTYTIPLIKK